MTADTAFDRLPGRGRRHSPDKSKSPVEKTGLRVVGIACVVCWLMALTFTSSWLVA